MSVVKVALVGNPNSGKTTIFNHLTGSKQRIANYPGVTIQRKEGSRKYNNTTFNFIDLPGTYSLTSYSPEELITRNYIIEEKPDVIVNILDSSNIERNLYLTTQVLELNIPTLLVFNMSDMARAHGAKFDLETLSTYFNSPIIETIGNKGIGIEDILDKTLELQKRASTYKPVSLFYGKEIEYELDYIEGLIKDLPLSKQLPLRWLTLKILEKDSEVLNLIKDPLILKAVDNSNSKIKQQFREHPEFVVAEKRYGFISGACQETCKATVEIRHGASDTIDSLLTHKTFGLPIFLFLMYVVFQLTFTLGEYPMELLETFFGWSGEAISGLFSNEDSFIKSLIVDGIIGGVGGVIVFLPNILLLFLAIAILEGTGYMARAAFVMDSLMHKIGLHGKSFIPMLLGFGCSVPAIMATRIIENRRDRLTTMLIIPLMSCGARLPIYALIIPAFFPQELRAPALFGIYILGIALAVLCAKILKKTILKGESQAFVMELPPYRLPTLRNVINQMLENAWAYLKKAGTIILGFSILLWAITTYPLKDGLDEKYSKIQKVKSEYLLAQTYLINPLVGVKSDSNSLLKATKAFTDDSIKPTGQKTEKSITLLLKLTNQLEEIDNQFEKEVTESGAIQGTLAYLAIDQRKSRVINELSKQYGSTFRAAQTYYKNIKKPFVELEEDIEDKKNSEQLAYTIAGRIGKMIEPIIRPMGFDWKIGTAILGALAAKEVFVSQLGIVYAVSDADESSSVLRLKLRKNYSTLVAICILIYSLISSPCVATMAITKRESGSWNWAIFQFVGLTLVAYILTTIVYQVGSLFM